MRAVAVFCSRAAGFLPSRAQPGPLPKKKTRSGAWCRWNCERRSPRSARALRAKQRPEREQ